MISIIKNVELKFDEMMSSYLKEDNPILYDEPVKNLYPNWAEWDEEQQKELIEPYLFHLLKEKEKEKTEDEKKILSSPVYYSLSKNEILLSSNIKKINTKKMLYCIHKKFIETLNYEKNIHNSLFQPSYDDISVSVSASDLLLNTNRRTNKNAFIDLITSWVYLVEKKDNEISCEWLPIFSSIKINGQNVLIEKNNFKSLVLKNISLKFNKEYIKKVLCYESKNLEDGSFQPIKYTIVDYNVLMKAKHIATTKIYELMKSWLTKAVPSSYIIILKEDLKRILLPVEKENGLDIFNDTKEKKLHYGFQREDLFKRYCLEPALKELKQISPHYLELNSKNSVESNSFHFTILINPNVSYEKDNLLLSNSSIKTKTLNKKFNIDIRNYYTTGELEILKENFFLSIKELNSWQDALIAIKKTFGFKYLFEKLIASKNLALQKSLKKEMIIKSYLFGTIKAIYQNEVLQLGR